MSSSATLAQVLVSWGPMREHFIPQLKKTIHVEIAWSDVKFTFVAKGGYWLRMQV